MSGGDEGGDDASLRDAPPKYYRQVMFNPWVKEIASVGDDTYMSRLIPSATYQTVFSVLPEILHAPVVLGSSACQR